MNDASDTPKAVCAVCPRHCRLAEGETGFCRARRCDGGRVVCANYGHLTSIAIDPIEKKPLAFFKPGSRVLSIGSYGCNMRCPFCQNDAISQHGEQDTPYRATTPTQIADTALHVESRLMNIGVAYTYNEPLVGWEFVRDCAREVRARGMANVLVSNGCAEEAVVRELAPLIDAANIDLKGPSQEFYDWAGGDQHAREGRVARDPPFRRLPCRSDNARRAGAQRYGRRHGQDSRNARLHLVGHTAARHALLPSLAHGGRAAYPHLRRETPGGSRQTPAPQRADGKLLKDIETKRTTKQC